MKWVGEILVCLLIATLGYCYGYRDGRSAERAAFVKWCKTGTCASSYTPPE